MRAEVLAFGLFLVGLSVIPLLYGYTLSSNWSAYGIYTINLPSTVIEYYGIGGILLAVGLAIAGEGIAMDSGKRESPETGQP